MTTLLRILIVIVTSPFCVLFYLLGLIVSIFFVVEGTFGYIYHKSIDKDVDGDEYIDTLKLAVVLILGIFIFPYNYIFKGEPLFHEDF